MSYDTNIMAISYNEKLVSIPLEQGNVLRLKESLKNVLHVLCLNPFGTGQCLTTQGIIKERLARSLSQSLWNRAMSYDETEYTPAIEELVSIPLEQGNVLRQTK